MRKPNSRGRVPDVTVFTDGRARELRYFNLFGDTQRYPEVAALQRLCKIELRILRIAERDGDVQALDARI